MSSPPVSAAAPAAQRASEIVRTLAREARPAGSDAESRARGYCAAHLRAAGFAVHEESFEYSAFPGRWGTPIGGLTALAVLLGASAAGRSAEPALAIALLALGGAMLALVAGMMALYGVVDFPKQRRRSVNVVATRGTEAPSIWLFAHVDSKSQPVPILVRAAGITLLILTWLAAAGLAVWNLAVGGPSAAGLWTAVAVSAVVGGLPVIATTVGSNSPGALDNASGVATVLSAAERTAGTPLGVCLTSAEELGLAGARVWARDRARKTPGAVALNCDGVDDRGVVTGMYSARRPDRLVADLVAAANRAGTVLRAHRLLPGVLTDGVALADAGWPVVTLSKGGVRTLARIHTPRDRAEMLDGTGIDEVARVIVEYINART